MISVSSADFVKRAGMDGKMEVQAARLALQKSQSGNIKQFAQTIVTDHTRANSELARIASVKRLTPPAGTLDTEHEAVVQSLRDASGLAFDSVYTTQMIMAHDNAIALFSAAQSASDPDIADFASKTLPQLQMHQQMLTNLHTSPM